MVIKGWCEAAPNASYVFRDATVPERAVAKIARILYKKKTPFHGGGTV
jgi:hypothetical protein